jgi:hypothetical protein
MDLNFKGSILIPSLETMNLRSLPVAYRGSNICCKTCIEEIWLIGDQYGLIDESSEMVSHRDKVQQYVDVMERI